MSRWPFAHEWGLSALREAQGWSPTGLIAPDARELDDALGSLFVHNYRQHAGNRHVTALAARGSAEPWRRSDDLRGWLADF